MANTWYVDYQNGSDIGSGTSFTGTVTLNPSDKSANITLSSGNLTATQTTTGMVRANAAITCAGRFYFEVTVNSAIVISSPAIGLVNATTATTAYPGSDNNGVGYKPNGQIFSNGANFNSTDGVSMATYGAGDVVCVAVDGPRKAIWFRVNGGNWNNTTNASPLTGMIGIPFPATSGNVLMPAWGTSATDADSVTFNFGATTYAQTPPAGFGNLVQAFQTIGGATAAKGAAAGDTIIVAKSPDATSLGVNGTWTNANQPLRQATKVLSAATNATPIAITTTTAHGWSTGDYVSITGAVGNTAANGQWQITVTSTTAYTLNGSAGNGTWTSGGAATWFTNNVITLASAVTATIDDCEVAWTPNVATVTKNTTNFKEGTGSLAIIPTSGTGFAAAQAAKTLSTVTDFSAYQQISFWVRCSSTLPGTSYRLCLCSAGSVVVNSFNIPAILLANQWMPVTIDNGAPLGSAIASIGFYPATGASLTGGMTILLDNIIACKAPSSPDSLSLTSLIGKSDADGWYGIASINGTAVFLDNATSTNANVTRGYSGVSETVTAFKRETIKTIQTAALTTTVQQSPFLGAFGSPLTISGGYNTGTLSQDGATYFDGQSGAGTGLVLGGNNQLFDHLNYHRYNTGIQNSSACINVTISGNDISNCTAVSLTTSSSAYALTVIYANMNNGAVNNMALTSFTGISITVTNCNSSISSNISVSSCGDISGVIQNICNSGGTAFALGASVFNTMLRGASIANNVAGMSMPAGARNMLKDYVFANNAGNDVNLSNVSDFYECTLYNCVVTTVAISIPLGGRLGSQNHNQVAGSHKIFGGSWTAITDTTTTHTSPTAWKVTLSDATRMSPLHCARVPVGRLAVNASTLVTVTAYLRRDLTSVNAALAVPGGQIAGVDSNVTSILSAAVNTYAQVTLTFTPTEAGVVDVEFWVWNGASASSNAWVTDLTFTQV